MKLEYNVAMSKSIEVYIYIYMYLSTLANFDNLKLHISSLNETIRRIE